LVLLAERGALAGRNPRGTLPSVGNCELKLRPAKNFVEKKLTALKWRPARNLSA